MTDNRRHGVLHAFMAEQATPPAPDPVDLPDSDEEVREPPRYEVLMHNDHYTTMDFVVSVLEGIFYKSPSEATRIMLAIHRHGAGRCGVYTREVAEMKVEQVHRLARKNEFPLRCSMQEAP
ncbi:MAG: ATP-dependent Clp protease adaptor ClpS [Spirochaetaceae bacterium]|nr:ATP-dependent Clp protease adaptor ClpS [Spirochaetaceae bacterium]